MTANEAEAMLAHYSRALDEVYRLRALAAATARAMDELLVYRSLPSGARDLVHNERGRLILAARGEASGLTIGARAAALRYVGAPETLTRSEWEAAS